ncbi:acyltransferase family protein [Rhodobacterales bacterium LSUCC1028]|nr:acyltransferase family protein [Rhodobacterales bacterium LSUCC1028]
MKYRAEIDGLRALAVVPVILFHAGFELFSGGFVGVDVFFVISGYLITTILIDDIENKRFSIVNFYERRARRILPALFFVMLVCIPFAWMWMLPSQMKDFSQSLVAVSLFASNILFWRESGYFDAAAEEKPLLHTWSLAVEEQYYVIFPIFLILAWRFGKNRVFWMIVVMAAISLLLSEWGWRNKATANFYLAPTRAWELFAGSIAAFVVQKQGVQKNNLLAFSGLVAIGFSIFFYDETTPFPSLYTLVPVLGVVLLVLYGSKETFAAKLLSTKVFVGIGLISYSAYLWHQPLLAFYRLRYDNSWDLYNSLAILGITLVMAALSWRFIEQPFRSNLIYSTRKVFVLAFTGTVFIVAFGLIANKFDLISYRLTAAEKTFLASIDPNQREYLHCFTNISVSGSTVEQSDFCRIGNVLSEPSFIVFGDSHTVSLAKAFNEASTNLNISGYLIATSSCPPLLRVDPARSDRTGLLCTRMRDAVINSLEELNISSVYLVGRWDYYINDGDTDGNKMSLRSTSFDGSDIDILGYGLREMIGTIESLGAEVFVLKQAPSQLNHPKTVYRNYPTSSERIAHLSISTDELNRRRSGVNQMLDSIVESSNLIELEDLFCNGDICSIGDETTSYYLDTSHLSDDAYDIIAPRISEFLRR